MGWIEKNFEILTAVIIPLLLSVKEKENDFLAPGQTLAEKNRNPGNIRYNPANQWKGQIGENGGFCVFSSLDYGLRAMIVLLRNYHRDGYFTINSIVSKYAPMRENPTIEYIDSVSLCSGINKGEILNFNSGNDLFNIVRCMVRFETGGRIVVTSGFFNRAISLT